MTQDNHKPIVGYEENGKPTTISYNVPEPSALNGRIFIELDFGEKQIFKEELINIISLRNEDGEPAPMRYEYSKTTITESMKNGFDDVNIFPHLRKYAGLVRLEEDGKKPDGTTKYKVVSNLPVSNELANLDPTDVYAALSREKNLIIFRSKQGLLTYDFVTPASQRFNEGSLSPTFQRSTNARNVIRPPGEQGNIFIGNPHDGDPFVGKKPEGIIITVSGRASIRHWRDRNDQPIEDEPSEIGVKGAGISRIVNGNRPQPYVYILEWKTTLPPITQSGTYPIVAYAKYSGYPTVERKITITVSIEDTPQTDTTPPEIHVTSPANNAVITTTTNETEINLRGTSSDSGGSGVASVLVNIGDGFVPAIPLVQNDWSQWSFQGVTSRTGQIQLIAKATDKNANEKQAQVSVTIVKQEPPVQKKLRLYLVESYRLSSYLGQYGAGRIVKTFSLLPGEKTRISVKTFTKTQEETKQSSSILDSVTDESTKDFEDTLSQEQSDKGNYQQTSSYEINARAEASWGWGKADVSGGVKGATSSARETFAKNVMNTTQKHASKASSKRDVTVNTSYEKKQKLEKRYHLSERFKT